MRQDFGFNLLLSTSSYNSNFVKLFRFLCLTLYIFRSIPNHFAEFLINFESLYFLETTDNNTNYVGNKRLKILEKHSILKEYVKIDLTFLLKIEIFTMK